MRGVASERERAFKELEGSEEVNGEEEEGGEEEGEGEEDGGEVGEEERGSGSG